MVKVEDFINIGFAELFFSEKFWMLSSLPIG